MNNTTTKERLRKRLELREIQGQKHGDRSLCWRLWQTVLMFLEVPMPFIAPSFYKIDLRSADYDRGVCDGPLAAAVIELIKILLNFVLNGTTTAGVGELGNSLSWMRNWLCWRLYL